MLARISLGDVLGMTIAQASCREGSRPQHRRGDPIRKPGGLPGAVQAPLPPDPQLRGPAPGRPGRGRGRLPGGLRGGLLLPRSLRGQVRPRGLDLRDHPEHPQQPPAPARRGPADLDRRHPARGGAARSRARAAGPGAPGAGPGARGDRAPARRAAEDPRAPPRQAAEHPQDRPADRSERRRGQVEPVPRPPHPGGAAPGSASPSRTSPRPGAKSPALAREVNHIRHQAPAAYTLLS